MWWGTGIMTIKLTHEFVKEQFANEGYVLLSKEYTNNNTKLEYVCSKNHKHNITWGNWSRGHRCPYCAGTAKLTLEQVRKSFEKEKYSLVSEEYVNSNTKLEYICPYGHIWYITWDSWKQGQRCPHCTKLTLDKVKIYFEKENYVLLSKVYINSYTKLDYVCICGHRHNITWDNWKMGCRCPTCKDIKFSGSGHPNWQGGISYEPYCPIWKDKEYKKDIKLRDGNRCLNPTCNKKDGRLHIHHIDYNKKNCCPSNVVTLCGSCNVIANTDRDWHIAWYQALMYRRYKYEY
jgi:hypothetical protein